MANSDGTLKKGKHELPVDRGWAWVICAANFFINYLTSNSFQVIAVVLLDLTVKFDTSITMVSLILMFKILCISLFSMISVTFLVPKFGVRKLCTFSGTVYFLCGIACAFVSNVAMFIALATIRGMMIGNMLVPSLHLLGHYFKKHRSLATTAAICGSSIASVSWPRLTRHILSVYGLEGTLLLNGAVEANLLIATMVLRPVTQYRTHTSAPAPDTSKQNSQTEYSSTEKTTIEKENTVNGNRDKCQNTDCDASSESQPMLGSQEHNIVAGNNGNNKTPSERIEKHTYPEMKTNHASADHTDQSLEFENTQSPKEKPESLSLSSRSKTGQTDIDCIESEPDSKTSLLGLTESSEVLGTKDNTESSIDAANGINKSCGENGDVTAPSKNQPVDKLKRNNINSTLSSYQDDPEDIKTVDSLNSLSVPMKKAASCDVASSSPLQRIRTHPSVWSLVSASDGLGVVSPVLDHEESGQNAVKAVSFLKKLKTILDFDTLRRLPFLWLMLSSIPTGANAYIFTYLPTIAIFKGASKDEGASLLSILGVVDMLCRIASGFLADSKVFKVTTIIGTAACALGVICLFAPLYIGWERLVVMSVAMGLFVGIRISLASIMFIEVFGLEKMGKTFSLYTMGAAVSLALHNPFLGYMFESHGVNVVMFYMGAALILSGVMVRVTPAICWLEKNYFKFKAVTESDEARNDKECA